MSWTFTARPAELLDHFEKNICCCAWEDGNRKIENMDKHGLGWSLCRPPSFNLHKTDATQVCAVHAH